MTDNQYLELYLSEAKEILTALNQNCLQLEKSPSDQHCIEEIFRACHTIKGNSAAMGFEPIVHVAHAMEHILSILRQGKKYLSSSGMSLIFDGLDALQLLVEGIQNHTNESINEGLLVSELDKLADELLQEGESPLVQDGSGKKEVLKKEIPNTMQSLDSIRVNIERLDALVNSVGELHISKGALVDLAKAHESESLSNAVHELDRIVARLQEQAMQLRLLPLKYLLNAFPRMVRDDARQESKEVELIINGAEIGLDRTILDEIQDPLVHILRNSVNHGIESPEERIAKGKSSAGHIVINAYREQSMVVIKIQDDGAGINCKKVKEKLVAQGLIEEDGLDKLSDEEVVRFITLPGFSMSEEVNERAGRGMGMNIVKNKIESIGGRFSIETEVDKGTTFTLHLPISMAIINGLLIEVGKEVCVLPLYNIVETIKLDSMLIQNLNNIELIPYRDGVLTLIRLSEKLGFVDHGASSMQGSDLLIVVYELNHQKVGFVVDRFIGKQEIVIKNLAGFVRGFNAFSGATILGDGRVAMILDTSLLMN